MTLDPFAPREPDPKNATQQVQSSLWRNLRYAYPNKAQAGQIAWVLIKAGKGEAPALERLKALPVTAMADLMKVAQRTRDSKTGAGNESWAGISSAIVAAISRAVPPAAAPDLPPWTPPNATQVATYQRRAAELEASGVGQEEAFMQAARETLPAHPKAAQ